MISTSLFVVFNACTDRKAVQVVIHDLAHLDVKERTGRDANVAAEVDLAVDLGRVCRATAKVRLADRVVVLAQNANGRADLLLVHEPTFHGGDVPADDPIMAKKRALIEKLGIPIYRFHDHSHFTRTDKINTGVLRRLGWEGEFDGQKTLTLAEPMAVDALISLIGERLGLRHLRYIGKAGLSVRTLSLLFGAWGDARQIAEFNRPEVDLVLAGEACEYSICEYARDAAELGADKGLLLLGHMGSEKAGMEYLTDYINEAMEDVRAVYIDCGEVYNG